MEGRGKGRRVPSLDLNPGDATDFEIHPRYELRQYRHRCRPILEADFFDAVVND